MHSYQQKTKDRINLTNKELSEIVQQWDIEFKNDRPEIKIEGSPERISYRIVVEDTFNKLYVLEMFSEQRYIHKKIIASVLNSLREREICFIQPYLKTITDDFIFKDDATYWQLTPFIPGIPLERPQYFRDTWRGTHAAEFLIDLYKKTESMKISGQVQPFSLKQYVLEMIDLMKIHNQYEYKKLENVIHYLGSDFFKKYDNFPVCFCHGDYHPLNIIWSDQSINAVIDWEFLGIKPEMYDIANMLGCIGIENPRGLFLGYAMSFLDKVKKSEIVSKRGLRYLLDCMMALRFGWLAEWFRKRDNEMIDLEITYLNLLLSSKDRIVKRWDI